MSLNPLMKKMKKNTQTTRKSVVITDDVNDLLQELLKPIPVTINSSKEEFVANQVRSEIKAKIDNIRAKGYTTVKV